MAAKKVGELIKEARTEAGYTQEQLARKIKGVSAQDISKAERGEIDLTNEQLKAIAKATGVTQTSLLNAPKGGTKKKTTTSSSSSSSSSSSASKSTMRVTATEKRLVELYRKADTKTKKNAMDILRGNDISAGGILSSVIDGAAGLFRSMPDGDGEDEE